MFVAATQPQMAPVPLGGLRRGEATEALRALDAAWTEEERSHFRRRRDGQEALPTQGQVGLGIAALMVLPIQLVGLVLVGHGLLTFKRARDYEAARDRYMDRRSELMRVRDGI